MTSQHLQLLFSSTFGVQCIEIETTNNQKEDVFPGHYLNMVG